MSIFNGTDDNAFLFNAGNTRAGYWVQTVLSVAPDTDYNLSAWLQTSGFATGGFLTAATAATGGDTLSTIGYGNDGIYTRVVAPTFNSGANTTLVVRIGYTPPAGGQSWIHIDDVVLNAVGIAPAAPAGLSATPAGDAVNLAWTASAGATSYNVYRGDAAGGESATPLATGLAGPGYTDAAVSSGTTYYYKVTAVNVNGESARSNEASATATPAPVLTAVPDNANSVIHLTWVDGSTGLQGFQIERSSDGGVHYTLLTTIDDGSATSYDDTTAVPGTSYNYRLTAIGASGQTTGASSTAAAALGPIDAAPSVVTAAAASPTPVAGMATALSVLGGDRGGESGLTYTWATTGTPPADVNFSDNADNAAKHTTAVFTKAGDYNFQVTISNGTFSTTSSVAIVVAQTLTSISVTPGTWETGEHQPKQFSAIGLDQFGTVLTTEPSFTWSVSSGDGSIDSSGLYTASGSPGAQTVEAQSGSISGSASVTISGAAPTVVTDASSMPGTVTGATAALAVLGADEAGESGLTYTWDTTGTPPAAVSFSDNGTNTAKDTTATFAAAGDYSFQVTISNGSLSTTSSVDVTVSQTFTNIAVTPDVWSIGTSQDKQFSAAALDQFGGALATQPSFTWSVAAGIGSVSSAGLYSSPSSDGTATVEAQSGSITGSASITINDAAPTVVNAAVASPAPVAGTTTALSVLGGDIGGESGLTYTWTTTGTPPADVTFSANGDNAAKFTTATFTKAGAYNFQVTISNGTFSTTSSVAVIVAQTLTSISVTPASWDTGESQTQQFSASPLDQFGAVLTTQRRFTWSVPSGVGSISPTGRYTAPDSGGTATVRAQSGSIVGIASVTVNDAAPTVAAPASAATPVINTMTDLMVLGADDGGESKLIYTWATVGTPPAQVTFTANGTNSAKHTTAIFARAGVYHFQVSISDGSHSATSSVTVTVLQTLTSITLTPGTSVVAKQQSEAFSAEGEDQFGHPMASQPAFAWSLGSGSVGTLSGGLYTAPNSLGSATVHVSSNSISSDASLSVIDGHPPLVAAAAAAILDPGGFSASLSVLGTDDGGEPALTYTWAATSLPDGAAPPVFASNRGNGDKNTKVTFLSAGTYTLSVTIKDALGLSVTSSVTVTATHSKDDLVILPGVGQTNLLWTPVPGATGYTISRSTKPDGSDATVIATGVTGTTFADDGSDSGPRKTLSDGTTYYYTLTAQTPGGPVVFVADAAGTTLDGGLLADSVEQFSGHQGEGGWSYGYSTGGDDSFTTSGFAFNISEWRRPSIPLDISLPYAGENYKVYVDAVGAGPQSTYTTGGIVPENDWAIRRWTTTSAVSVEVSGMFGTALSGANGQIGHIFLVHSDGGSPEEIWKRTLSVDDPSSSDYSVHADLKAGDSLDFAVSTQPGYSDQSTGSIFTATISKPVDLIVDSDNNDGLGDPTATYGPAEAAVKDDPSKPGKVIEVGGAAVPMVLNLNGIDLSSSKGAMFEFTGVDPSKLLVTTPTGDNLAIGHWYDPGSLNMRSGSGVFSLAAIAPSASDGDQEITVTVDPTGDGTHLFQDKVRVTNDLLNTLQVADANGNQVTAATPSDAPVLNVTAGSDGTAHVTLSAGTSPDTFGAQAQIVWAESGDGASTSAADHAFHGAGIEPDFTLAPTDANRGDFTFYAGFDTNNDGTLEQSEITRTVKVHLCVELDWNTDDNGPALAGELIPLDGGAATPLDDARVTGQTGNAGLVVDWGDGSPTDDGSLIHFFDKGTYTIAVSYGGAALASLDATVIHSTNSFDPHDQPSNPEDLNQLTTSDVQIDEPDATLSLANSNSEAAVTADASASAPSAALNALALASPPLGAPQPAPDAQSTPSVIIKENIPLTPAEETSVIAQEVLKGKTLAVAHRAIYVGVCNMTTDTAPRVIIPGDPIQVIIPSTDNQLYIPVSRAQTDDGTRISGGGYDLASKVVREYARIAKCTVTDDGSGNLTTTLPGGVELDLQKEGGYGVLQVKRPEVTITILFADAYRSIVPRRADGSDITDIDRLDGPGYDTLVEEKNGAGLRKVPPPRLPKAITTWVSDNITDKAQKYFRIAAEATSLAKSTNPKAPYEGPNELPSLGYIKSLKHLRFELSVDCLQVPGFAQAVSDGVSALQTPAGWTVDVVYK